MSPKSFVFLAASAIGAAMVAAQAAPNWRYVSILSILIDQEAD